MKRRTLLLAAALVLLVAAGAAAQGGGDSALPPVAQHDTHTVTLSGSAAPDESSRRASEGSPAAPAAYSLTWWTADGGGASFRSGGSYTLGGTAGQPDAAAERGDAPLYLLRAGFWQPACAAAAVTPAIARAGTTVTLSWTHDMANQAYRVHRGTAPYSAVSDAILRAMVTAAPWSYTDPEAVIGNPATNYYYLVRAACGAAYADPGRVGEFDFTLVPGN